MIRKLLPIIFLGFYLISSAQERTPTIEEDDSPLMRAVKTNNLLEVKKLVSSGTEINEEKDRDWDDSPVDVAVLYNYQNIALYLLEKGAIGRKYFYKAVRSGDINYVSKLLNYGYTDTEAVLAAAESGNEQLVDLLIAKGYKVNFSQKRRTGLFRKEYVSPLDVALDSRKIKMVLSLVDAGAPLDEAFIGSCYYVDLNLGYQLLNKKIRLDELHYLAVLNKNIGLARKALQLGANPNYISEEGYNCLQIAIKKGDKTMIKYGQDECHLLLSSKTTAGANCWMLAAESKNVDLFNEMIQLPEFDINAADNEGQTVLFYAANSSNSSVLESLLTLKPDVNKQNNAGLTAPMLVLWNRFNAQFDLLKQLPINYKLTSNDGVDLLGYYVASGSFTESGIEEMIKLGCDPNRKDKYGSNLAYHAVEMNSLSLLEKMKGWGVSLEPLNKNNNRPNKTLNKEVTQFILTNGASTRATTDTWGETYLESALKLKDIELFAFLLRIGADPNQSTRWNKSILFECIDDESVDFLKILLQYKVNTQVTDTWGKNALELAIEKNYSASVTLLRQAGAKTKSEWAAYEVERNKEISGLKDLIATKNLGAVLHLLKKYTDVKLTEQERKSLVVPAVEQENLELIKLLFEQGLMPNETINFEQQNLAHLAAKAGKLDLLKLFVNKGADPMAKDAFDNKPIDYAKDKAVKAYLKTFKN